MPETERLILSLPQIDDFDGYYKIHSDPRTNLFNPGRALFRPGKSVDEDFLKMQINQLYSQIKF